jgi:hypothetical protein
MIYEQQCYEAHRRIDQRQREAEAERNIREARARRRKRRRLLIYARLARA